MISGIGNGSRGLIRNLQKTRKSLRNSLQALASGTKLTASSNPAGLAIAESLASQSSSLNTVNTGINYTTSALATAEGGLGQIRDSLQQMRDLAVQASNGTLSSSDRTNLQQQFQQLQQNINSVASTTSFGDTQLLNGTFSQNVQTGTQQGDSQSVSIKGASTTDLNIQNSGVATQSAAQNALSSIDNALQQVNASSAQIGATQNGLSYAQDANAVQAENVSAAKSQISDTNVAQQVTKLTQQKVLQNAQVSVLQLQLSSQKKLTDQFFGGPNKKR